MHTGIHRHRHRHRHADINEREGNFSYPRPLFSSLSPPAPLLALLPPSHHSTVTYHLPTTPPTHHLPTPPVKMFIQNPLESTAEKTIQQMEELQLGKGMWTMGGGVHGSCVLL